MSVSERMIVEFTFVQFVVA